MDKYVRITVEIMDGDKVVDKNVLEQKNFMGVGINREDEDTNSSMVLGRFSKMEMLILANSFSSTLTEAMQKLSYHKAMEVTSEDLAKFIQGLCRSGG